MAFMFFRIVCRFVRSSLVMAFVSGTIVRKVRRKIVAPIARLKRLLRGESWRNISSGMADRSDARHILSDELMSMVRLKFLAATYIW